MSELGGVACQQDYTHHKLTHLHGALHWEQKKLLFWRAMSYCSLANYNA